MASTVAVGVSLRGEAIGLALATFDAFDSNRAELRSVALAEQHQGAGLGIQLLQAAEEELRARGCIWVSANFPDDSAEGMRAGRMLRAAGWAEAQPLRLLCKAKVANLIEAPWTRLPYPARFEFFPWSELTAADRAYILDRKQREAWYPDDVRPFRDEPHVRTDVSLGLRCGGRVVGWCIGMEFQPDTIWVDSLFVSNEVSPYGGGALLIGGFIRGLPHACVVNTAWQVDRSNQPMIRFTERRLKPLSYYMRSTSRTFKTL